MLDFTCRARREDPCILMLHWAGWNITHHGQRHNACQFLLCQANLCLDLFCDGATGRVLHLPGHPAAACRLWEAFHFQIHLENPLSSQLRSIITYKQKKKTRHQWRLKHGWVRNNSQCLPKVFIAIELFHTFSHIMQIIQSYLRATQPCVMCNTGRHIIVKWMERFVWFSAPFMNDNLKNVTLMLSWTTCWCECIKYFRVCL